MKAKKWLILFSIIIFGLLAVGLIYLKVFEESKDSVENIKADYELVADQLYYEFETDETSANEKYLNKVLVVTGFVESIELKEEEVMVYIKPPDAMGGILCSFDPSTFSGNNIKEGDTVRVKGICNGYLLDVVLNKCSIEKIQE